MSSKAIMAADVADGKTEVYFPLGTHSPAITENTEPGAIGFVYKAVFSTGRDNEVKFYQYPYGLVNGSFGMVGRMQIDLSKLRVYLTQEAAELNLEHVQVRVSPAQKKRWKSLDTPAKKYEHLTAGRVTASKWISLETEHGKDSWLPKLNGFTVFSRSGPQSFPDAKSAVLEGERLRALLRRSLVEIKKEESL